MGVLMCGMTAGVLMSMLQMQIKQIMSSKHLLQLNAGLKQGGSSLARTGRVKSALTLSALTCWREQSGPDVPTI